MIDAMVDGVVTIFFGATMVAVMFCVPLGAIVLFGGVLGYMSGREEHAMSRPRALRRALAVAAGTAAAVFLFLILSAFVMSITR